MGIAALPEVLVANRHLLGLIKLFAAVVGADREISAAELAYVHDYLLDIYPERIAEPVFQEFCRFAGEVVDIPKVVDELNALYSLKEKLFLVLKMYEVSEVDYNNEAEIVVARDIAARLGLSEADLKTIESIYRVNIDHTIFDRRASILPLRVSADQLTADIHLAVEGLDLEIYKIQQFYYVRQRDSVAEVRIGSRLLHKQFVTRISPGKSLSIGDRVFEYVDLLHYFKCRLGWQAAKTLFLGRVGSNRYKAHVADIADCCLEMSIHHLAIELTPRHGACLTVNGRACTGTTPVLLCDTVCLDGATVEIRKLVFESFAEEHPLDLSRSELSISNGSHADIPIIDELPHVWHSYLRRDGSGFMFENETCPYDIFLDGVHIRHGVSVATGNDLCIANVKLNFDFERGTVRRSLFNIQHYRVDGVQHRFSDRTVAIDDISFEINRGELVAIIGPSGCGKSTLLNILNGCVRPSRGAVLVENFDLHSTPELATTIGYVPQDDLLHEELTVYENLAYGARLRFPAKSSHEIDLLVNCVLDEISLSAKRHHRVGNPTHKVLSGGERKRLNIGLELLSDSAAYLLDEPTSGLSSEDSLHIIELLKYRALRGKIVFVVIHQPSSRIFQLFDKIVLLDRGGKLAYCGSIQDAMQYFEAESDSLLPGACPACGTVHPDTLLEILEAPLLDIDGTPLGERKHHPDYWQRKFEEHRTTLHEAMVAASAQSNLPPPVRQLDTLDRLRQTGTLLAREFTSKLRNRSNLWTTCLVAPLLGLVVSTILRNKAVQSEPYTLVNNSSFISFFFLAAVIAIFLALSNSIAEIIKDRPILIRERMLDIPRYSYLFSKYAILCLFGIVQIALFLGVSFIVLEVRELFILHWVYLSLTVMAATAMGLFISSWPSLSEKAASNLLPLVLIPQIILAGSDVFKFDDMKHLVIANWWPSAVSITTGNQPVDRKLRRKVPEVAEIALSRWAYEGLVVLHATFSTSQAINAAQQDLEHFLSQYKEIEAREGKEAYRQQRKRKEARVEQLKRELASYRIDRLDSKVRNFGQDTFLVSHKQVWFSERRVSTVYYNAVILGLFALVFFLLAYMVISSGSKLTDAWRSIALVFTSWRKRHRTM